jgi:iron-sulfur cluster assembly accessory protein
MDETKTNTGTATTGEQLLIMTPAAIAEVKRLIGAQPDNAGMMLRVGVTGGGCSGLSYAMQFDKLAGEFDHTLDFDGLTVVIDAKSLIYLSGTTIDFSTEILSGGFKFHNPNSTRNCGCGTSFSV